MKISFKQIFCILLLLVCLLPLAVFVTALVLFGLYYKNAMKYFGGVTGDLAGCFLSLCELFCTAAVVIAAMIPGI